MSLVQPHRFIALTLFALSLLSAPLLSSPLPAFAACEDPEAVDCTPPESTSSEPIVPLALIEAAPTCDGQTATIWVNSSGMIVGGDDDGNTYSGTLDGTTGNDVMVGTGDDDRIDGKNGMDVICALGGEDTIEGGFDDDRIFGGLDDDDIEGEDGDDVVCGDAGNDTLNGGIGNDTLCGDAGDDELSGGIGDDRLNGGTGVNDDLDGELSNDTCVNGETVNNCEDTATAVICPSGDGGGGGSSSSNSSSSNGSSTSSSSSAGSSTSSSSSTSSGGSGGGSSNGGGSGNNGSGNGDSLSFGGLAGTQGAGSRRGSDSQVMRTALLMSFLLAGGGNNLPPAAFGGDDELFGTTTYSQNLRDDVPPGAFGGAEMFTSDQRDMICLTQRMIGRHIDRVKAIKYMAALIRDLYGFNILQESATRAALMSVGFCEPLREVRLTRPAALTVKSAARQTVSLAVDSQGAPVSSEPIWNQCIRGITPRDESGNAFNCRRFQGFRSVWYHPDFPNKSVALNWNARDPRPASFPSYFVVTILDETLAGEELLIAARALNHLL